MTEQATSEIGLRVRELEHLLATIRRASGVQLDYDMWDRHGRQHASAEQCSAMDAAFANASRERENATSALQALVTATRAGAPAALTAWTDAHDAYLAAFLDDCAARGESEGTAAFVARSEREHWAEVRAGTRAFVDENVFYVTMNAERYRELFDIDP